MNPPTIVTSRNYYDVYAYDVIIDGLVKAAFSKCTGLTGTADVIEYAEGGEVTPHKSPGMVNFGDITLERGETDNNELYLWWKSLYDSATGFGSDDEAEYKKEIIVRQKTRAGDVVRRWRLASAWPSEFGGSDWDNSASEHHIEHVTISYEGFEQLQ